MNKTCKDCIKHDVCEWYGYVDVQTYSPENCMFFKSKDEYVKVAQDQNKPTRSEQRRINVQQGKPVNYGLEPEYIERETVVAFLENMAASRYLIQCFENKEKFPAVNVVEIKHGNWIEDDWVEYDGHSECIHHSKAAFVCSNCRHAFKKELLWIRNYCPNCGAKMNGKEN